MQTIPSLASLAATPAPVPKAPMAPDGLAPVPAGTMQVRKGDFVAMALAMKQAFMKVRGPERSPSKTTIYPKTTNTDVRTLIQYWTEATQRYKKGHVKSGQPERWQAYAAIAAPAARAASSHAPNAVYTNNFKLWREIANIAMYLEAIQGPRPSKWEYAWDAIKDSASDLPDTLAGAGNVAGRILVAPIAGASSALGINSKTLLAGAAIVVVSVFVASRILRP